MYKKVLVPLDGSELAECAIDHVKELITGCQATEVTLLSVVDLYLPAISSWGPPQAEAYATQEQEKRRQKLMRPAFDYLTRQAEKLKAAGIDVQTEILEEGGEQGAADVILLYARDHNFDLIVMSTHGRSGITKWAFGNVADKVVSRSLIPVLTVIPNGCRLPL